MENRKAVILVVEDNAVIRMGAVDLVIDAGFEALEASSADEAIRILETRPDIHLVFTDVEMPGTMDG
jgi:two-component system, response regulator PdtaR